MLDYLIKGGTVIDGTGAAGVVADVGVRDGRIVAVGTIAKRPRRPSTPPDWSYVRASSIHTRTMTPSSSGTLRDAVQLHGVTRSSPATAASPSPRSTPANAEYLLNMMVKVEGMPKAALEEGVPWTWRTFGEFLDCFEGRLGVNAGFLVGHCASSPRHGCGVGRATKHRPTQIDAMKELLHESDHRRRPGFLDTLAYTHSDGDGQPVPSRWSTADEVLALCEVVSQHAGHHTRARQRRLPQRVQR